MYIVSFYYYNNLNCSMFKDVKDCIVIASSKDEAEQVFNDSIRKIFNYSSDVIEIIEIKHVREDAKLIYMQAGAHWIK